MPFFFLSHWYDSTPKAQAGFEPRIFRPRGGRLKHLANEVVKDGRDALVSCTRGARLATKLSRSLGEGGTARDGVVRWGRGGGRVGVGKGAGVGAGGQLGRREVTSCVGGSSAVFGDNILWLAASDLIDWQGVLC